MLDNGKLFARLGADSLGRRVGRDEVGKGRLEPPEGFEQAIVLLIRDLGLALDVVEIIVPSDLSTEGLEAPCGLILGEPSKSSPFLSETVVL